MSASDTPLTSEPNVAVMDTDDDDTVEPEGNGDPSGMELALNDTVGAYPTTNVLDAALAGVMLPLPASIDTVADSDDPSVTSIVYTPPPDDTTLLTTHPTQLKSDATTPVTSLPNVDVTTTVVDVVVPSMSADDNTTDGAYVTDMPPLGVPPALLGTTPVALANTSTDTSDTSPSTDNDTSYTDADTGDTDDTVQPDVVKVSPVTPATSLPNVMRATNDMSLMVDPDITPPSHASDTLGVYVTEMAEPAKLLGVMLPLFATI